MVAKDQATTRIGMPMVEFIRAFDEEGPFELIDGERQAVLPNVAGHEVTTNNLFRALLDYEQAYHHIEVFCKTGYVLTEDQEWVLGSRIADVVVFGRIQIANYKSTITNWKYRPLMITPVLCVEVASHIDTDVEMNVRVSRYLSDGVAAVWVVSYDLENAFVYRQDTDHITRLTADDALEDADLLPGFSIKVRSIFPE